MPLLIVQKRQPSSIALLFFHIEQLRSVVIELKIGKFEPAHVSQLEFYVALVDDRSRREVHSPTVGILICGSGNKRTVRYSLGRTGSPSQCRPTPTSRCQGRKSALPTVDQLAIALDWQVDKGT
ncbi:PDDEXK nuclease domain-containing protein [Rhodoglobus vestalii]|uniref:PDDEXK nuclease domain-containing protein n=1 Tax=Rhodoglobus vestalii TaxID=193384 RepID=UPI001154015C|nr:PDDEXK nuclease domain-containing protein [Rhodoglobus vestalii]